MWKFLRTRGVDLPIAVIALTVIATKPAWATGPITTPLSAAGGFAGVAIIGAIVIAKLWRRK